MTEGCVFCDHDRLREADVYFENDSAMASDRESKIPPTGDLIRGVPAPGGTWPDHETSSGGSREAARREWLGADSAG